MFAVANVQAMHNVFATATVEPIELIRSIKVLVQLNIGYKGLNVLLRDAVGHFLLLLLYNKVHCYYLNLFAILAKGTVQ